MKKKTHQDHSRSSYPSRGSSWLAKVGGALTREVGVAKVGGALTREPLIDQRVDVIGDEGHGREISHLRLADDLDASTLLPLPVDV